MIDVKIDVLAHMEPSKIVGTSVYMDRAAQRVKDRVIANALTHRDTGAFINSLKIKRVRGRSGRGKQITDRLVYSDDPGAMAIEYGRTPPGGSRQRPVGGQHNFTEALVHFRLTRQSGEDDD